MQVHQQPCHIVYTDYRPTPLQHYIFPSGGDGLYLVVDDKGKFREDSFQKALNALVPANEGDKKRENGKWQKGLVVGKSGEDSDIFKMVKMIIQRQYDPVICFSFSKRECEFLAMQVCFLCILLKRIILRWLYCCTMRLANQHTNFLTSSLLYPLFHLVQRETDHDIPYCRSIFFFHPLLNQLSV